GGRASPGQGVYGGWHRHRVPRRARRSPDVIEKKRRERTGRFTPRIRHALDDPPRLASFSAKGLFPIGGFARRLRPPIVGRVSPRRVHSSALEPGSAPAAAPAFGAARSAHGKKEQGLTKQIGSSELCVFGQGKAAYAFFFPSLRSQYKLASKRTGCCLLSSNSGRFFFASFCHRMWIRRAGYRSLSRRSRSRSRLHGH